MFNRPEYQDINFGLGPFKFFCFCWLIKTMHQIYSSKLTSLCNLLMKMKCIEIFMALIKKRRIWRENHLSANDEWFFILLGYLLPYLPLMS